MNQQHQLHMKSLFLSLIIAVTCISSVEAQLFKKLQNRVQDKIEQRLEDKVVEELSEEIARRAMKPIDNAFDEMFRRSYKEQYGKEYDDSEYEGDPEKQAEMMQAILGSMYGDVDLPESYNFEHILDIAVTDFGEKKSHSMRMLVAPSQNVFAMEQEQGKKEVIMVFDFDKDKVILFNQKDKTVMAIPNVMKMAGAFAKVEMEKEMSKPFKFEKINKSKKVAGYQSQGFKYEADDDKGEFFVTTALPFDWQDTFGSILEQMSPNFYKEHPEYDIKGMLMYSETKRAEDGKKSKWEVKKVSSKDFKVVTADYKNTMGR